MIYDEIKKIVRETDPKVRFLVYLTGVEAPVSMTAAEVLSESRFKAAILAQTGRIIHSDTDRRNPYRQDQWERGIEELLASGK
jgi:hypothetical protein